MRPRTIRGQLMAGLLAFELLLVGAFALFVIHEQAAELRAREFRRLQYQANMVALMAQLALADEHPDTLQRTLSLAMQAPSIQAVRITDPQGRTILSSDPAMDGSYGLAAGEKPHLGVKRPSVFDAGNGNAEAVAPVAIAGNTKALVWIYPSEKLRDQDMQSQLRLTLAFAAVGALGCILLSEYLGRSITRPLSRLLQATRRIIRDPVDTTTLPPDPSASSEVADLTMAFNLMVAAVEEQRAGLNDTLALLDSMLAHAPVGMAFFDSHARFIRMNQFFADMNGLSVGKHIGRSATEIFEGQTGKTIAEGILSVFKTSEPVRDLEVSAGLPEDDGRVATWLVNIYPVRSAGQGVRWVGAVIVDTTGIKRSEDALRRTEKLAAVGRLSASIAHEINNPLEAITNLLYLLRRQEGLDEKALAFTEMAEHEVARMSEIVQQTLRFHRQSTRPAATDIGEILDSVLSLHRGKVLAMQVQVERRFRGDVELFCFSGEMRQLFANLIGNALDAMPAHGGRMALAVRYSRSWKEPSVEGVRIVVADTGAGMDAPTQRRIFEPFFTTKESTGTGLGLWVSAEIIQKHRGTVCVRSRTAQAGAPSGTVFMLFLPHRTRESATAEATAAAGVASSP